VAFYPYKTEITADLVSSRPAEAMNSNQMKKRAFTIIIHACVWFIFLSLPYLFKPSHHNAPKGSLLEDLIITPRLVDGLLLIGLFYFNYYIVIPKFYAKRKYLPLVLSLLLGFVIFLAVNYNMRPTESMHHGREHGSSLGMAFGPGYNLFMFIIVYVCSFTLSLYNQLQTEREEKLNTEISFLKAQINPHFLFNTLNSIYSLALAKSDKTPDAVVKLSGMMRYAVSDSNQQDVPLSKELNYITNYIDLQKMRIPETVKINYSITGNANEKKIVPFMIIPFVENAFKYGINPEENSEIYIDINIKDRELGLVVFNKKVFVQEDPTTSTGLGIRNTKERLRLQYPGKHSLTINETDDSFTVTLNIKLS